MLYSTLLVLASLAVTVAGIRQVGAEQKDAAKRLAHRARVAFPCMFGLIIVLTIIT